MSLTTHLGCDLSILSTAGCCILCRSWTLASGRTLDSSTCCGCFLGDEASTAGSVMPGDAPAFIDSGHFELAPICSVSLCLSCLYQ